MTPQEKISVTVIVVFLLVMGTLVFNRFQPCDEATDRYTRSECQPPIPAGQ